MPEGSCIYRKCHIRIYPISGIYTSAAFCWVAECNNRKGYSRSKVQLYSLCRISGGYVKWNRLAVCDSWLKPGTICKEYSFHLFHPPLEDGAAIGAALWVFVLQCRRHREGMIYEKGFM